MTKEFTKPLSKSDTGGVSRHATRPATAGPGTGSQTTSRVVKSRSTQVCRVLVRSQARERPGTVGLTRSRRPRRQSQQCL